MATEYTCGVELFTNYSGWGLDKNAVFNSTMRKGRGRKTQAPLISEESEAVTIYISLATVREGPSGE